MSGRRTDRLHVAAAAVFDHEGRVLLARRPAHAHQGNLWEFPGGKLEAGETAEQALSRELWEELHIRPRDARPLIRVPYRYPDRDVFLDVWRVDSFDGVPEGREGQAIRWVRPDELVDYPFPAANEPITKAVRLPATYAISGGIERGEEGFLDSLERCLRRRLGLLQLRLGDAAPTRLMEQAVEHAHLANIKVLINGDPELAVALAADGVHLNSRRLAALDRRPLPKGMLVGASCHDSGQLEHAVRIDADFAVLSPVLPTSSHPEQPALGWPAFAELVAELPIPVYALGGLGEADLHRAWAARAQGVAGISAFWPST